MKYFKMSSIFNFSAPFFLNLSEAAKRKIFDFEDCIFEKRNRLELSGIIKQDDLVASDQTLVFHAAAYHAVWCRNLRELFREAQKTGYHFENFIDIGAGKGKACFMPIENIISKTYLESSFHNL